MNIYFDYHEKPCTCSYCGDGYLKPKHWGLNIPKDKSGWWVFKLWSGLYLRLTFSKLLNVQRKPITSPQPSPSFVRVSGNADTSAVNITKHPASDEWPDTFED